MRQIKSSSSRHFLLVFVATLMMVTLQVTEGSRGGGEDYESGPSTKRLFHLNPNTWYPYTQDDETPHLYDPEETLDDYLGTELVNSNQEAQSSIAGYPSVDVQLPLTIPKQKSKNSYKDTFHHQPTYLPLKSVSKQRHDQHNSPTITPNFDYLDDQRTDKSTAQGHRVDWGNDLSTAAGHHGGHGHHGFFQYARQPAHGAWEFGYRRGNHEHFTERHEHGHNQHKSTSVKSKVRWGDKHGGYGEHYFDYNHAGTGDTWNPYHQQKWQPKGHQGHQGYHGHSGGHYAAAGTDPIGQSVTDKWPSHQYPSEEKQ